MQEVIAKFESKQRKKSLPQIRSGDTVRVHQKIKEGGKERIQVFEGMVIRARKRGSLQASITVRKVASGVGVEKIFPLHSPTTSKVEVVKHGQVRRNYLTYIRKRAGRAAKLRERAEREAERLARLEHEQSEKADAEAAASKEDAEKADKPEEKAEDKAKSDKSEKSEEPKDAKAADKEADKKDAKEEKKEDKSKPEDKAKSKKEKAEEFRKTAEAKKK